jgi:hypothetical protein
MFHNKKEGRRQKAEEKRKEEKISNLNAPPPRKTNSK